jgi:hypothetical protein
MAARIKLSTGVLVRGVQREDLVANEVVASGDALRDGVSDGTARFLEGSGAPDVGSALTAVLLDLEPDSTNYSVNLSKIYVSGKYTQTLACSCCNHCPGTSPCT